MSKNMENSQKLKEKLMETYQDKSLEDLEKGEEIETTNGLCYRFTTRKKLKLKTLTKTNVKQYLTRGFKTNKRNW